MRHSQLIPLLLHRSTCTDAPIPIRLFIIGPVKRSASTAPDGTPGKKLLSNNFVVRRHVPPWGPNVPKHTIFCLPVDKTLSAENSHNVCRKLTTSRRNMTPVSQFGGGARASASSGAATKSLFFPLFHRAVAKRKCACDSLVQHEFTRAVRALQRCSNASDELELHCLSAANPFLFCLSASASHAQVTKSFFSRSALRGPKNDGGDVPASIGDANLAAIAPIRRLGIMSHCT